VSAQLTTGRCLEVAHTYWVTPRHYGVGMAATVGLFLALLIDAAMVILANPN
jgi:hypothetical protein